MYPILIFSLLSLFSILTIAPTTADDATAYDLLQSYDFPIGILPKGVTSYDLDESTGKFHVYFGKACAFSLEGSYQLRYKSTISGVISEDKITNLSGISVKVLFLWLNIVEVRRNGEELEFSIGIASANFPIDNFYENPQCGCGFDCNSRQCSTCLAPQPASNPRYFGHRGGNVIFSGKSQSNGLGIYNFC
ncbi:Protein of unknown function DUF538 [Dillenia turbinata]|uniref:DUF538 family protein n=1 Tax=Dillenia turbinata TaxID=194707 RepID=A0AAN8VZZ1_9MAGN